MAGETRFRGIFDSTFQFIGLLKPDGTLAFTAGAAAPPPPPPRITAIVPRDDGIAVSFSTVAGATYRLRSTDAAGLGTPVANWAVGATAIGTGSSLTLEDRTADGIRFYAVEARP